MTDFKLELIINNLTWGQSDVVIMGEANYCINAWLTKH